MRPYNLLICGLVVVAGLLLPGAALADSVAGGEVEIERLTWTQIRDRLAAGATTAIVPTGGTEQNGRHMVTGKHNFIVAETARRVARTLGTSLVAPVLAYVPEGDSESRAGHMAYPGTISVPEPVFAAVLEAAARSLKVHGFKTIVFLGDSGGNQSAQDEVAARLSGSWAGEGVRVVNAARYYASNGGEELLRAEGESGATIGSHAGIRDTAELMAVYPEGVKLSEALPDTDGAEGDARRASADLGERLIALKVTAAVDEIRAAEARREAASAPPRSIFARLWKLIFG